MFTVKNAEDQDEYHEIPDYVEISADVTDFQLQVWRQIVYHKDKWVTREMKAFLELASESL